MRRVARILEVPEVVHPGDKLTVRIHGRPHSHYVLLEPNRSGFLPIREFGTFLLHVNVDRITRHRIPASGVAEVGFDVPSDVPVDTHIYYQAIIQPQDPEDPRLFVLTACPGLVVRPR